MTSEGIKARMLLCDAAQVQGGKLYILGGGWSRVVKLQPIQMALGINMSIPWHAANKPMQLIVRLLDADGNPLRDPTNEPIRTEGQMEVGRPPGLKSGTLLDSTIAIGMPAMDLNFGAYTWVLELDGETLDSVTFEVVKPPPGLVLPSNTVG